MKKQEFILCCDWGTSNFRLFSVDTKDARKIQQVSAPIGIANMFRRWEAEKEQNRIDFFRQFLHTQIQEISVLQNRDLSEIPVVISGMASSSIGIVQVPYTALPFDLSSSSLQYQKIDSTPTYGNELYLFGGLKDENDIMRGEEVELIGLHRLLKKQNYICLLPGTHSKHIFVKQEQVVKFKTYMTGEIFQLLKEQSTLKTSLSDLDLNSRATDYFTKGVMDAKVNNFLSLLFNVRTNAILHQVAPEDNLLYLSGITIGSELKDLLQHQQPLVLAGSNPLFRFYNLALTVLGLDEHLTIIPPEVFAQSIPKAYLQLYDQVKH